MQSQMTFKYMVDFLNSNRDRKIQLLKVHVKNFNGLKHSEIINLIESATKYFSRSLEREMLRQRKEIKVYGKCNLNRPTIKNIIIR